MTKALSQLTYSRVVSTLALFLALGGGAYAISLGRGDVTSRVIKDDTIRSDDVKRQGLKGSDIKGRTLNTAQFTAAASESTLPSCDPEGVFVSCGELALRTPVGGRVLAIATGEVAADAGGSATCDVLVDGTQAGRAAAIGAGGEESFSVVGVSEPVSRGQHAVALQCVQDSAPARVFPSGLTAVLVGGG